MYSVGDKIVYPMHGAGVIEAIEVKKVLKEKQTYYIMKMPVGGMILMIPTNNTEEIGIRGTAVGEFNENWNKRYRENMIKIRSGDIYEVLEVVKMLMLRDKTKGLSTGERKMLNNSKHILLSELVLSEAYEYSALERLLDEKTEELFNNKCHNA